MKTNFLYLMLMEVTAPHSHMLACARLDLNTLKNYVTKNVFKRGSVDLYDPVANPIANVDLSMKITVKQSNSTQQQQSPIQQQQISTEQQSIPIQQQQIQTQQQYVPTQFQQIQTQQQQILIQKSKEEVPQTNQEVQQDLTSQKEKIQELEKYIQRQKEQYEQLLKKQRNVQVQKAGFYKYDYQPPPLFFKNEQYPSISQQPLEKRPQEKPKIQVEEVHNVQPLQFENNNVLDKLIQELLDIKVKQQVPQQEQALNQKIRIHGRTHVVRDSKVVKRSVESEDTYSQDFEQESVDFRKSIENATPKAPRYSSDFESISQSKEKFKCNYCQEEIMQLSTHICKKIKEESISESIDSY